MLLVCMMVWGARANQRHTVVTTANQECASDLCICTCVCVLTAVVHADKSGQTKTDTFILTSEAGERLCTTCASGCAATISLIHTLCLSVCLYMYVRVSWCLYIQCWGAIHVQQVFDVSSNSCHIHSYVHTLTHIQHFHSSTALCKKPRETHSSDESPSKMPDGRVDNLLLFKWRSLFRGGTES